MKTKKNQIKILMAMALIISLKLFPQSGTITLTFTGDLNGEAVSLDSVWIKNLSLNCDTTLYSPDLSLLLQTNVTHVSSSAYSGNGFTILQNFPNPFTDHTLFSVYLPQNDRIEIIVSNLLGQRLAFFAGEADRGSNMFTFSSGKERVYLVSVKFRNEIKSIRMLSPGNSISNRCTLNYSGPGKSENIKSATVKNYFDFNLGDQLLFVGNASSGKSGFIDFPETDMNYALQFATNIPCIGVPTVDYEGQIYNTIQIFSQCWLKENLNAGDMVLSSEPQANNEIIEKYCMGDMATSCTQLGGLYFWNEMMNYTSETGGQGICPDGWHVPDDLDWQILEGAVDSEYGIGDIEWTNIDFRGSDAGGNLKQSGTAFWEPPNTGATDAFGFNVLPAGYFVQNGFWGPGYKTYLWTSVYPQKFYRNMNWNELTINRNTGANGAAFSVRCIKNQSFSKE